MPETSGCDKIDAAETAKALFDKAKADALKNGVTDPEDTEDSGCWLSNVDFFGETVDILCTRANILKVVASLMTLSVFTHYWAGERNFYLKFCIEKTI